MHIMKLNSDPVLLDCIDEPRTQQQTLGSVLKKSLCNSPDDIVLNLHQIVSLGGLDVNSQFRQCRSLSLNQNRISSLLHLPQFERLQSLSLRGNLISSVQELQFVFKLAGSLEELCLSENRICDHPGYRSTLVSGLPYLRVLDDVPVFQSERDAIRVSKSLQRTLIPAITSNYLAVQILNRLSQTTRIKHELFQQAYCHPFAFRSLHTPPSVADFHPIFPFTPIRVVQQEAETEQQLQILTELVMAGNAIKQRLDALESRFGCALPGAHYNISSVKFGFAVNLLQTLRDDYAKLRHCRPEWDIESLAREKEIIIYPSDPVYLQLLVKVCEQSVDALSYAQERFDELHTQRFWEFHFDTKPWHSLWSELDGKSRHICEKKTYTPEHEEQGCGIDTKTRREQEGRPSCEPDRIEKKFQVTNLSDERKHTELQAVNAALLKALQHQTAARLKAERRLRILSESIEIGANFNSVPLEKYERNPNSYTAK